MRLAYRKIANSPSCGRLFRKGAGAKWLERLALAQKVSGSETQFTQQEMGTQPSSELEMKVESNEEMPPTFSCVVGEPNSQFTNDNGSHQPLFNDNLSESGMYRHNTSVLKGLCHGQKCLHCFHILKLTMNKWAQYPVQMEAWI